ncbi:MAG TPA: hypothetical protein VIK91_24675, partial [Nannocystis sp.]
VVEGAIDDATLTRMLEVLRRSLGDPGKLEHEAGARIWSTTSGTSRRIHFTVVEQAGSTTLRLEESMSGEAGALIATTGTLGGFFGFMTIVPLKVFVIKAVILLLMGPLALTGALFGWLGGRALWRRRSLGREEQLRRIFGEIVKIAEARKKALDPAGAGGDDRVG